MPFYHGQELKKVYGKAKEENYGFIASNVAEPNVLVGILEAGQEKNADVVIQLSKGAAKFAGGENPLTGLRIMSQYVQRLAADYDIGVFLNLDHFKEGDLDLITAAIEEELISSVMIDASKKPFSENVKATKEVVELAEKGNVLVEGELGMIKGVEDENTASDEAFYTEPDEAVDFVSKTGVDLLAVSIGTQHGVSKGKDIELRTELAKQIDEALVEADEGVPLVLHGSSGLMEHQLKKVLNYGICKMNKDTRYQYEYARSALDYYFDHEDSILPPEEEIDDREGFFSDSDWSPRKEDFDPRVVSRLIRERIKKVAGSLFEQSGAVGESLYS